MPAPTVDFLGRAYRRPVVASAFRAKPQPSGLGVDLNTLILIGDADNGTYCNDPALSIEQRIMLFYSFDEARDVLGGGDLLDAIKAAKTPSKEQGFSLGPQRILALNTRNNTPAVLTLADTAAGTRSLVARIPGPRGNAIRIRVSDNGDRLELRDGTESFSQTGLAVADISIAYAGDATQATLTYDGASFTVLLSGQTDGSQGFSIDAAAVPTIAALSDRINANIGFTASWLTGPDLPVAHLDHYAAVDLLSGPASLRAGLWRHAEMIRRWGLTEHLDTSGTRAPLADTTGFLYLQGGGRGTPGTAVDYINALRLQRRQNGFYLNVLTHIPAVHAALFEEAVIANSPEGGRERFAGAGADHTLTYSERLTQGKAINSQYMVFGVSPVTLYQSDGITLKTFPGWMLAVLHNAIKASANVRETAFNKALNIQDAPEADDTDVDRAIENGCLCVDRTANGVHRIAYDVTTYSGTNLIYNKAQLMCLAQALNKDLRQFLEDEFLGKVPVDRRTRNASITDSRIRKAVTDRFNRQYVAEFGWLSANEYTGAPAFDEGFTIERQGNAIYFIFPDGKLVTSLDFIFSLLNFDVIRGASNA